MNPRLQFAFAVVMVAGILAIVYSPFVDLPLTDAQTKHGRAQVLHALPASAVIFTEAVQVRAASGPEDATVPATDVVAITCAYLC